MKLAARRAILLICLLAGVPALPQSASTHPSLPRVRLILPEDVRSETVSMVYEMEGPFGSYGGFVQQRAAVHEYWIEASSVGKPAHHVKLVAYAPGCQLVVFDRDLSENDETTVVFDCVPLPPQSIRAYLDPKNLPFDKPLSVVGVYEANWLCVFFGWKDCMVPQLALGVIGTLDPADHGYFTLTLPDLASDPQILSTFSQEGLSPGVSTVLRELEIVDLRVESQDRKILGWIQPKSSTSPNGGLVIQAQYPALLDFQWVAHH